MNYSELQSALGETGAFCPAEQWHGLLCGLLCSGRPVSAALLQQLMVENAGLDQEPAGSCIPVFEALMRETGMRLSEGQFDFALLLPDDDESLPRRTQALGDWCESFLFGLSAGGLSNETELTAEVDEFIADLAEISRVEFNNETASDEDEIQFSELVEYVRLGVLLINDEFNPVDGPRRVEH